MMISKQTSGSIGTTEIKGLEINPGPEVSAFIGKGPEGCRWKYG